VTAGSVTFTVSQDGTTIGTPVSVAVEDGTATATYSLPAGTHAGTYTVTAAYADAGSTYSASTDQTTLAVARADQSVVFEPPAGVALDAAVTLTATAGSGLDVTLSSTTTEVCTVAGTGALTLLQAGTCTITAVQTGDGDWKAATSVSHIAVTAAATTTTAAPASTTYSPAATEATLDADVTSGLGAVDEGAVTFTVSRDGTTIGLPVSVAVDGGTASTTYALPAGIHAGTYDVDAAYTDSDGTRFEPSTDRSTLTVGKADQTIELDAPRDAELGSTPAVQVSAGSGLPVTLGTDTASVCTVGQDGLITLLRAGICTVRATQPGDGDWNAAEPVTRDVAVGVNGTRVTAHAADATYSPAETSVDLTATVEADHGVVAAGSVVFTVTRDGTTAGRPVSSAIDDGTATAVYVLPAGTHAGDYTVTADYADDAGTYGAASDETRLTIAKADQTVSLTAPGRAVVGRAVTVATSSDSGLPVTLRSGTAAICTVDTRGRLTPRKPGTCVVTATQGGDEDWNPAPALTRSVAVAAAPVVAPPAPDTGWYSDPIPKEKRKRLAPARPGREGGPVRLTKAAYRTHDGTLAVPLAQVRGRQLTKGRAVQLTGLFRFDSARLSASGRRQLAVLARSMDDVEAFTCEGYADYGNAVDHERQLSERRAETVCTVLARKVGHGVKAKPHGYGPSRPMVVGGHSKQRTGNRRVDLLVRR
jgi:outer membrane protein OmpA-like peptidoglycan-associated protein